MVYVHIYIYIEREREREGGGGREVEREGRGGREGERELKFKTSHRRKIYKISSPQTEISLFGKKRKKPRFRFVHVLFEY